VPAEPPLKLPLPPELPVIITTAEYDMSATSVYTTKFAQMTTNARNKRDAREKQVKVIVIRLLFLDAGI
jgi:hypothetical protein